MAWRRAQVVALVAALLLAVAPTTPAVARQTSTSLAEPAADGGVTLAAAQEQRAEAIAQLEDLDAKVAQGEDELNAGRRDLEDASSRLTQVEAQIELNGIAQTETAEALVGPTRRQAELAVEVYVSGEPALNAVWATIRTGQFDTSQERTRVIFSTVRGQLLDDIDELTLTRSRLERVADDLATVRERAAADRADLESAVAVTQETLAKDRAAGEALRQNLSELDELIATLPRPTTTSIDASANDPAEATSSTASTNVPGVETTGPASDSSEAASASTTTRLSDAETGLAEAETTTTTARDLPFRHLLTGVPTDNRTRRPALAVKIDNASNARPQAGLNQADIVFEEIVEGGRTRFVAVFQSTPADPIGPVRSARTSDLHILANLNSPLFANSGANPGTLGLIAQSSLANVNVNVAPSAYFRSGGRRAPHNLYSRTSALWNAAPAKADEPPSMFVFRPSGFERPNAGRPVTTVAVAFGAETVTYSWNGEGWQRSAGGRATVDSSGVRVAPANVVVQFIEYGQSPVDSRSPEAIVVGSGAAWVLTDGHLIDGSWHRPTAEAVTEYVDAAGEPILFEPGATWIALPRLGSASVR